MVLMAPAEEWEGSYLELVKDRVRGAYGVRAPLFFGRPGAKLSGKWLGTGSFR